MYTLLKDEYLKPEHRLQGSGYRVGVANRSVENMPVHPKENTLLGRFEGLHTFMDFIEKNDAKFGNRKAKSSDDSQELQRSRKWVKYPTYEEAVDKMKHHPEIFRNYTEADVKLKDYEAPSGFDTDFDLTGDFVDIGRVVEGQPEVWGTMRNGSITSKFANIIVAGMCWHGIDQKDINERSSRIMRLVDMLEANNVRCSVTVLYTNDNWHCELVVKQYNELLDIDDIAVATSADFFRRLQFRFAEHSATLRGGYGQPNPLHARQLKDEDTDLTIVVSNKYNDSVPYWEEEKRWTKQFEDLEKHLLENGIERGDTAELLNDGLVYNDIRIRNT